MRIGELFLLAENPTQQRGRVQYPRNVERRSGSLQTLRLALAGEIEVRDRPGERDVLEERRVLPPVEPERGVDVEARVAVLGRRRPEGHEPVRIRIGQGLKQNAVDHAEDRRTETDTQGERRRYPPSRRASCAACAGRGERPRQIVPLRPTPTTRERLPESSRCCRRRAGRRAPPRRGFSRFYPLLRFNGQVRAQFFGEIAILLLSREPQPDPSSHSLLLLRPHDSRHGFHEELPPGLFARELLFRLAP